MILLVCRLGNFNGKGHDGNFGRHPNSMSGYKECLVDYKIPNGRSFDTNLLAIWRLC